MLKYKLYAVIAVCALLPAATAAVAGYLLTARAAPETPEITVEPPPGASAEANIPPAEEITHQEPETEQPEHHYILSIFNGYVAVFSTLDHLNAIQVTTTPASALPPDEKNRLAAGIEIFTDEQLARVLQDYGS